MQKSPKLLKRLLKEHVAQYWPRFTLAMGCMILVAATTAVLAWLMEPVLDDIFVNKKEQRLWQLGVAVMGVFVVKGAATYGQAYLMALVGNRVVSDLQQRLFTHIMTLPMRFFHQHPAGTIMTRFTADVQVLRGVVSSTITGAGKDLFTLIFLLGVMFWQDWQLALLAFFVFPLAIYPIRKLGLRVRKIAGRNQVELGAFSSMLSQVLLGIRQVKAYGREAYESSRASGYAERLYTHALKTNRVQAIASPIMEILGGIAIVAIIVYGGSQVISGDKTTGSFFSFITAFIMAYEPVKKLSKINTHLQTGMAAASRLYEILDLPGVDAARDAAPALIVQRGEIIFEDVSFSYADDEPVLHNISFTVQPGQRLALVGASGGGKSTILNLLLGFYTPTSGRILIDGQDITAVSLPSLRLALGFVSQEIALFTGTIADNIRYGDLTAGHDAIEAAAKQAAAHRFIMALPREYNSLVGEQGLNLSGGQRQRLAIARAILKDAPIMLLDEATSALDSESEHQVQTALDKLCANRTSVVVAHRLSTVQHADRLLVMEAGKIVESGTHTALLSKGRAYARLCELQFSNSNLTP